MNKLQKTAETAGFDNSGSLPESRIKEFEAAKMKAIYSSKKPAVKTDKSMSTFVWDMIGKFKVMSVNGANYSHGAVKPVVGQRFVYPVKGAHADAFIEVLANFIAFLGTLPTNFVFKVFRADAGTVHKSKAVQEFLKSHLRYRVPVCVH